MTKKQALDRVADLSRKIGKGELSLDAWKWQRAEAMAQAADAGARQREIAKAAGFAFDEKNRRSNGVQRHIAVATRYPSSSDRPAFSEAYDEVTGFDRGAAQARTDMARATRVVRESPDDLIASLPDDQLERLAQAAHNEQIDRIRTSGDTTPAIDMGKVAEDITKARERSIMPILNLNHAFSALRIGDPLTLIGHATPEQRRQWAQRWPEDIEMLGEMLEAVNTVKLRAVENA